MQDLHVHAKMKSKIYERDGRMSVKRCGTSQAVERMHVDEFTTRSESSHSPHVQEPDSRNRPRCHPEKKEKKRKAN